MLRITSSMTMSQATAAVLAWLAIMTISYMVSADIVEAYMPKATAIKKNTVSLVMTGIFFVAGMLVFT